MEPPATENPQPSQPNAPAPLPPLSPPPRRASAPTGHPVPPDTGSDPLPPPDQTASATEPAAPAPLFSNDTATAPQAEAPPAEVGKVVPAGGIVLTPKTLVALAIAGGALLIAIPLLLWVVPWHHLLSASPAASSSAPVASVSAAPVNPLEAQVMAALDGGVKTSHVELGAVRIAKCQKPGPGRTRPEDCDQQPWFAEMLVRAVLENSACAPERAGTVSVALKVDYRRRKIKVFAGKSGSLRGRRARRLIKCVRESFPTPDWASLHHDHTKYILAVPATYPEPAPSTNEH